MNAILHPVMKPWGSRKVLRGECQEKVKTGKEEEKRRMRAAREFDLTVLGDANIIVCTSLLWRADKSCDLGRAGCGLHGWRQNISL